jgi:hypothetical protein
MKLNGMCWCRVEAVGLGHGTVACSSDRNEDIYDSITDWAAGFDLSSALLVFLLQVVKRM